MLLSHAFERLNFLRRPDWRFRRVRDLVEGGGRCTRRDDEYIKRMLPALRLWLTMEDREKLLWEDPACYYPLHFYFESLKRPHATTLLEAMLLTGMDDQTVADSLGILFEAVNVYGAVFFDVRKHLQVPAWILPQVIFPLIAHKNKAGAAAAHCLGPDVLLVAYLGGPDLLNQLIGAAKSGKGKIDDFCQANLKRWVTTAAASLHGGSEKVEGFLRVLTHLQQERSSELTPLEKVVDDFLKRVKYNVGGPLDPKFANTPLAELDDLKCELRDDELHQAARGERPARADEMLELENEFGNEGAEADD